MNRARRRHVLIGSVTAVGLAIAGIASWTGTLSRIDDASIDTRFAVRGERTADTRVAVVGIDDRTLDELDLQWPFRRSLHARVLDTLTEAGAKTIGYDVAFAEPTTPFDDSPQAARAAEDDDVALLEAISRSQRVVLAANEFAPQTGEPNILFVDEDLAAAKATYGNTAWAIDGAFRRLRAQLDGVTSFPVAVAGRALGSDVDVPGGTLVDFPGTPVTTLSFVDVYRGNFDRSLVRDRVVIVGGTVSRVGDLHPTPFGGPARPGPEINANAVATILDGTPLRERGGWVTALASALVAFACGVAALWRRPLAGFAMGLAVLALFALVAQLLFDRGFVLAPATPLLAGVLVTLGGLTVNAATVIRERRRLHAAFARFLPEPLVDQVVDRAGDTGGIPGERRYATVLFADLRGFTAAAEKLPPESVIAMLNHYLTELGDAVLDHGGTVVSYQGDGIMAVFGAPVEQADHADRALAAAREIRDVRLPAFNDWAAAREIDPFDAGIGIASGPVMSGTVGSARRLEYTTVGDTTNAAARLQALSKDTPHMMLVADATRAALTRPAADLVAVGSLDVRGREVPASVWTLAAARPSDPQPPSTTPGDAC